MILFLIAIAVLTAFFAGCMLFIQRKVVTSHRGGLMILLSGGYFTLFFCIAHLLKECFQ